MKQDRKLNKMIMFASILGVIAGSILLVAGAGTSVFGFLKPEELLKIEDLTFFITQEGIISLQNELFKGLLKTEYLYLFLGGFIAVVGLLVLIFSIVGISYAKKRKIVRHRVALLIFNLIPLAIASCVAVYLVLEFKTVPNIVKYVGYGVGGVFAVIGLSNLLGVICSRSEKFMSNDNNKYTFDNSSLRNARAEVNNSVKEAEYQPAYQEQRVQQGAPSYQQRPQTNPQEQSIRPQGQPRPMQSARPQQSYNVPQRPQQARPMVGGRPQMNNAIQSTPRPVSTQTRPVSRPAQMPTTPNRTRPQQVMSSQGANMQRPTNVQHKYCLSCGSLLTPGEMFCKVCGTKVNK